MKIFSWANNSKGVCQWAMSGNLNMHDKEAVKSR